MDVKKFEPIDDETEALIAAIIDCAYKVYIQLGPGLLESVYETCLCKELAKRNISFQQQFKVPVVYDGETLDEGFRIDLYVEGKVVVELKAVNEMLPVFQAQVITYLKLTRHRIGLLINFNVPTFKGAAKRIIL
ncbi:MAG: GxxExxY protein [Bacteroidetes bacterium]|nr:GxxExxY protein [Bacteroidota bacterium]